MAYLTPADYDALERAIFDRARVAVFRHGREIVVVPERLSSRAGGEVIEARHPSTGEPVVFVIAEIEGFEVVKW